MDGGGLDARTWLTILGVFVLFFVMPGCLLEYDRRKKLREADKLQADQLATATHTAQPAPRPAACAAGSQSAYRTPRDDEARR